MTMTTSMVTGINRAANVLGRSLVKHSSSKTVSRISQASAATITFQPRSLALLGQHIKNSAEFAFFSRLYDLNNLRFNLMAASSLILVTCRSVVANSTARKAKGTPQEVYRYQEAVKTTFREFLTFAMTYVILMYAQRCVVDALRSLLWVRKGVTRMPTSFNRLFQSMCSVPQEVRSSLKSEFGPTIFTTFKETLKHIKDYRKGTQILPKSKMALKQSWIQAEVAANSIEIDLVNRKQQYDFIYKTLVKPIAWVAGKDLKKMSPEETLKLLFEWAPPLIGAIPAIILSGFYSEWATQQYAEPFARFVAGLRAKNKNSSNNSGQHFSGLAPQQLAGVPSSQPPIYPTWKP